MRRGLATRRAAVNASRRQRARFSRDHLFCCLFAAALFRSREAVGFFAAGSALSHVISALAVSHSRNFARPRSIKSVFIAAARTNCE
jgi:hypothetical protein